MTYGAWFAARADGLGCKKSQCDVWSAGIACRLIRVSWTTNDLAEASVNQFFSWVRRHDRRMEWGFFAVFGVLFLYAGADALGILPGEPGWRPRASVVMTAGLLLQPTAALVGRRVRALQFALLALSIALMVGSLRMTS